MPDSFKSLRWVRQDRIVKRGPGPRDHALESPMLAMFMYASDLDDICAIGLAHDDMLTEVAMLRHDLALEKISNDNLNIQLRDSRAQIEKLAAKLEGALADCVNLRSELNARNAQIDRLTEQVETAAAVINVKHGDWMGVIQRLAAGRGFAIVVDPDDAPAEETP